MLSVGHQGGRPDAPAGADLQDGHGLVAQKADQRRRRHRAQVGDLAGVEELVDQLVEDVGRAEGDGQDDQHAGHVLGAMIAIVVAAGGQAPGQVEGDQQGNGVERVAQVVHRVGQQGYAAAQQIDGHLEQRGQRQQAQRDPDGADALLAGRKGRVGDQRLVAVAVAAQVEHGREPAQRPRAAIVIVPMPVVMVVIMIVIVVVSVSYGIVWLCCLGTHGKPSCYFTWVCSKLVDTRLRVSRASPACALAANSHAEMLGPSASA